MAAVKHINDLPVLPSRHHYPKGDEDLTIHQVKVEFLVKLHPAAKPNRVLLERVQRVLIQCCSAGKGSPSSFMDRSLAYMKALRGSGIFETASQEFSEVQPISTDWAPEAKHCHYHRDDTWQASYVSWTEAFILRDRSLTATVILRPRWVRPTVLKFTTHKCKRAFGDKLKAITGQPFDLRDLTRTIEGLGTLPSEAAIRGLARCLKAATNNALSLSSLQASKLKHSPPGVDDVKDKKEEKNPSQKKSKNEVSKLPIRATSLATNKTGTPIAIPKPAKMQRSVKQLAKVSKTVAPSATPRPSRGPKRSPTLHVISSDDEIPLAQLRSAGTSPAVKPEEAPPAQPIKQEGCDHPHDEDIGMHIDIPIPSVEHAPTTAGLPPPVPLASKPPPRLVPSSKRMSLAMNDSSDDEEPAVKRQYIKRVSPIPSQVLGPAYPTPPATPASATTGIARPPFFPAAMKYHGSTTDNWQQQSTPTPAPKAGTVTSSQQTQTQLVLPEVIEKQDSGGPDPKFAKFRSVNKRKANTSDGDDECKPPSATSKRCRLETPSTRLSSQRASALKPDSSSSSIPVSEVSEQQGPQRLHPVLPSETSPNSPIPALGPEGTQILNRVSSGPSVHTKKPLELLSPGSGRHTADVAEPTRIPMNVPELEAREALLLRSRDEKEDGDGHGDGDIDMAERIGNAATQRTLSVAAVGKGENDNDPGLANVDRTLSTAQAVVSTDADNEIGGADDVVMQEEMNNEAVAKDENEIEPDDAVMHEGMNSEAVAKDENEIGPTCEDGAQLTATPTISANKDVNGSDIANNIGSGSGGRHTTWFTRIWASFRGIGGTAI